MSSSPVRLIKGDIECPLLRAGTLRDLRLVLEVNSAATAAVSTFASAGGTVRSALTKTELEDMAAAQSYRLKSPVKPNATLNFAVDDKKVTMVGFGVSPTVTLSRLEVAHGFNVVGVDAALDGLDFQGYQIDESSIGIDEKELLRDIFDPNGENAAKGDFVALLRAVTEKLIDSYEYSSDELRVMSQTKRAAMAIQHQINLDRVKLWYAILDRSTVTFSHWVSLFDAMPGLIDALIDRVIHCMTLPGGFWNAMIAMLNEFRVIYIPSLSGAGRLVRMEDKMILNNQTPVPISATSFTLTDGSTRLLSLGSVIVMGEAPAEIDPEWQFGDIPSGMLARYPSTPGYGYSMTVPAPVWVASGGKDATAWLIAQADYGDGDPLRLDASADTKDADKAKTEVRDSVEEALTNGLLARYAQAIYEEVLYADSRITMQLPAAPGDINVGERRLFQTSDGGTFSGFVAGITFMMSLSNDELSVSASVSLTHVKFNES